MICDETIERFHSPPRSFVFLQRKKKYSGYRAEQMILLAPIFFPTLMIIVPPFAGSFCSSLMFGAATMSGTHHVNGE
jgi:hypothetical protein